ncbi:LapA family protein [Gallaecimonas sp. GXIMD4217]|uniref:LapA family protein n=1 Tax=Gallaecimonas sp. GXIMD4217 TaxID=3131927 RepID=UPI00311B2E48
MKALYKFLRWLVLLALFVLMLAIGSQNPEPVSVNFLIARQTLSLGHWLGIAFAIGALVSLLLLGSLLMLQRARVKLLTRKLNKAKGAS